MGMQTAHSCHLRSECGSNSLKPTGPGAGRDTPGTRVVSWLTAKITPDHAARGRSIANAAEFCRNGKEQRRQFLNATKPNDVCYVLWLRKACGSPHKSGIFVAASNLLCWTQSPRFSEIAFSGISLA
jgi:hypothetical protein